MRKNSMSVTTIINPHAPKPLLLPAPLERKIAARWREWEPWVRIQLQHRDYAPEVELAEFARLRKRHSEQMLALRGMGMPMRLVRRHRLDDPRITDEARAVMVRSAMARRRNGPDLQCSVI
jgi:hypothetical protein